MCKDGYNNKYKLKERKEKGNILDLIGIIVLFFLVVTSHCFYDSSDYNDQKGYKEFSKFRGIYENKSLKAYRIIF